MSTVSVVMPTHDRSLYLSEAIASVLEQRYRDWELIIVDDGSTDDTPAYLASLSDPRIRTIRRDVSGGAAAARNDGLALARGEMIMFLDDDDVLRDTALTRLVGALDAHPDAVAAVGACRLFRENADSVKVFHPSRPHTRTVWPELLFGWWANSGQNLYRTSAIRGVGGFDAALRHAEDRKLWLYVARSGPVCLLPSVTMEYRQHEGQTSKRPNIEPVRQQIWSEFIAQLPPATQRDAVAIRRAAVLSDQAVAHRANGEFWRALGAQLRACSLAPRLLRSPLTSRPLWWGLKKCLLRDAAP
jgi:glycosyltransferase involved in cell wall biosynthesis